ncbi:Crp/Fnr family transcriptional regulator [Ideonella sp.]|uniref:Crp/Fnr family transcriptional regulator n=1 Tax=Ideonella sp. TaxID=1929293 RepID=UPI003BB7F5D5
MDHPDFGRLAQGAERRSSRPARLPFGPDADALRVMHALPAAGLPAAEAAFWSRLFQGAELTAAQWRSLSDLSSLRGVGPGSVLFEQGTPATEVLLLREGDAALGQAGSGGEFRPDRPVHGPAWLDLSAAWLGKAHAQEARAVTEVQLMSFSRDALFGLADRAPALWRRLGDALAREVQSLVLSTHELMHKDAPARLAAWLNAHCQPLREGVGAPAQGVVHLTMRKRDIASQLAITPETLSRLMRSFSGQGLISVAGYTVHVHDLAGLARLAQ